MNAINNELDVLEVKKAIGDKYYKDVLEKSPNAGENMYICPFCGSGTGEKGTGAFSVFNAKEGGAAWHCFACGRGGDVFDLCQQTERLDFSAAFAELVGRYGTEKTETPTKAGVSAELGGIKGIDVDGLIISDNKGFSHTDFNTLLAKSQEKFTPECAGAKYLENRGIRYDTAKRYGIGWDGRNLIFPNGFKRGLKGFKGNVKGVGKSLFNAAALTCKEWYAVIVEGEIDALTLLQDGINAVGLSSVTNSKQLKPNGQIFFLLLDNDTAGIEQTEKMLKSLYPYALDCHFLYTDMTGDVKDVNAYTGIARDLLIFRLKHIISANRGKAERARFLFSIGDTAEVYSDFNDTVHARRLDKVIRAKGHAYAYTGDGDKGEWLYYNGIQWTGDGAKLELRKDITDIACYLSVEQRLFEKENTDTAEKDPKAYAKKITAYTRAHHEVQSIKTQNNIISAAQLFYTVKKEIFDADIYTLNTPTGVIDLHTGAERAHSAAEHLTKCTNAGIDKRPPGLWLETLGELLAPDWLEYIQKAAGYSLTGDTKEQCIFWLKGAGGNGKSLVLDTLREVLGDYAIQSDFSLLVEKSYNDGGASPNSALAALNGRRFAVMSEPNDGAKLNESLIKQITGGGSISTAEKYQRQFTYTPQFKIWIDANNLPVFSGKDNGIWRRLVIIPFDVTIQKPDKTLFARLKAEYPQILYWCLEGLRKYRAEGLQVPADLVEAYRQERDIVQAFLKSDGFISAEYGYIELRFGGGMTEKAGFLYDVFCDWCKARGLAPESATAFGRSLEQKGYVKTRASAGMIRKGLTVARS